MDNHSLTPYIGVVLELVLTLCCFLAQTPAPVYDIRITPYQYTARVTWKIRRAQEESSYITNIIICFNGTKCQNKSRGTEAILGILKPDTSYNVEIATQDGSFQNSTTISKVFKTRVSGRNISTLLYNKKIRYMRVATPRSNNKR